MKESRNGFIDEIKGISIILVIFGHCIQYGSGSEYLQGAFFGNPIFVFIYSFHMPLFMLISGYLFGYSIKKYESKSFQVIRKKIGQLIIPIISWSIVPYVIEVIVNLCKGDSYPVSIMWIWSKFVSVFIYRPWFLWAVWWCSLIVLIVRKYFGDSIFVYLFILTLTFVTPDIYCLGLYKYLYPFFLLSYFFSTYDYVNKIKFLYTNSLFEVLIIIGYFSLLTKFRYETFVYTTGYTLIGKEASSQLYNDCLRFGIGLLGSLSVICVLLHCKKIIQGRVLKTVTYIGRNTMGIYLASSIIFAYILPKITSLLDGVNWILIILETLIVLAISLGVTSVLHLNKVTNKIFLGGR